MKGSGWTVIELLGHLLTNTIEMGKIGNIKAQECGTYGKSIREKGAFSSVCLMTGKEMILFLENI